METPEKYIKNVYLVEGENFKFLFTLMSCGRHFVGPRYVIFMDCQTQKKYTGTTAPGSSLAIITIPGSRQRITINLDKPFLLNGRG